MFGRNLAGLIVAIALSGASAGAALAQTTDVTAALTEASKVLQKGGYVKAIEIIDGALRSGKVPSELAAKALLLRAEANEKLGRTAFALADYNSSLWMQGLSASDRKRAEEGHGRVMKGLGVSAPPDGDTSAPASTGSTAPQPQGKTWNTDVQQAPAAERSAGGGIGGFFSNLFGSSSSSQRAASEQPTTAAAVVAQTQPEPQPQPKAAPKKAPDRVAAPARPAAPAAAAKSSETGAFAIQLAAVAEEDKAIAETDRIAKKFGADLGGRTPSLMIVPTSDGGTLYKIVAAPFETRGEGQATCELLKSKGVSCMVITKK
jgi:hypothetical protein